MKVTYLRDDTDNVEAITFGSSPDDFLQVQRALEFDEQDARLGMDTYCLVTATGAVIYGGIADWTIHDSHVRLTFTRQAMDTLGLPAHLTLFVDGDDSQEVCASLGRMLS